MNREPQSPNTSLLPKRDRKRDKGTDSATAWLSVGILVLIALLELTLFAVCVIAPELQSRQPRHRHWGRIDLAIFSILYGLWLWTYVATAVTEPGTVPRTVEWIEQPDRNKIWMRTSSEQLRYNAISASYVPDRAHFCSATGQIVLRMDHYCPYLKTAVGWMNYAFFHQNVLYAALVMGWALQASVRVFVWQWSDLSVTWGQLYVLLLLMLLSFYMLLIAVPFYVFHVWLILHDCTTLEFMNGEIGLRDRRVWHNWTQTYSTNLFAWILPIQTKRLQDGLYFAPPDRTVVSTTAV